MDKPSDFRLRYIDLAQRKPYICGSGYDNIDIFYTADDDCFYAFVHGDQFVSDFDSFFFLWTKEVRYLVKFLIRSNVREIKQRKLLLENKKTGD